MSFKIQQKSHFYLLDFSSVVDKQLIIIAYSTLLKEKNFNTETHTLWDFRGSMLDLSINDILEIAQAVTSSGKQRSEKARSAFLTYDPSDTSTLQTYITATAHYPVEFQIFDDYHTAVNWLKD